jgi:DNA-3-methyladenine glycosylase
MSETGEQKAGTKVEAPSQASTKAPQKITIRRLRRSQLPVGTVALARYLIGKIVVRDLSGLRMAGRIVETEAYPPKDPAAHHYCGLTPRTQPMFLERGHAYIYFAYGNHFMLNVTAELPGVGGGILIRALEPLEGIAEMERRRGTDHLYDLTRGPGRLAQALHIDRSVNGIDLCAPGPLWLGELTSPRDPNSEKLHLDRRGRMGVSRRIGITKAANRLLRFYERGSRFVSGSSRLRA